MGSACRRCGLVHDVYAGCAPTAGGTRVRRSTVVGDDEALVGHILAERYRVDAVLGMGMTGTVFAVEQIALARPAALKVLRPRFADPALVAHVFQEDARIAWSVSHACLCEVFDIGTLPDGAPYFVMERLEGETLAKRLSRDRLSVAAAVDVMMQLLSAIAAVHARALLFRDLRPQNVFLAQRRGCRPLVKILDFGLTRLIPLERVEAEWSVLESTVGAAIGPGSAAVPHYLSPERVYRESVEPASDLFVAAAIFYEMLAGQRPFGGSSWSSIVAQVNAGAPVPLRERRPELPDELVAFVEGALAADPRARPATAKAMQDDLRAIFEGGRRRPSTISSSVASGSRSFPASEHSSTFVSPVAPPPRRPVTAPMPARASAAADGASARGYELEDAPMTSRGPVSAPPSDRTLPPSVDGVDRTLLVRDEGEDGDYAETETTRLSPELQAEAEALMQTPAVAFQPAPIPAKPPRSR